MNSFTSTFITAISTGFVAFSATNIDDIVILLLFFSQVDANFRLQHIVAGQYLGFTALILLSLPGFFGGLVIPQSWIGLLGLIPISIGISSLVNHKEDPSLAEAGTEIQSEGHRLSNFFDTRIYSVASVTVANGSDNISVYVPLFANSELMVSLLIIMIFFVLLGVWCYAAYKLTHQKTIANIFTHYSNYLVPFVLMGLGTFIVLKSGALSPIKLIASSICLMILVKKNDTFSDVGKS